MKVLKILLCGILLALPVFAEESDDRQTATSLHYVSHELDTRQNKLSAGTNAALTYTNAAGNVEQRTVKENLNGGITDTSLPQVNAVNVGLNTKQDDITTINDHTAVTYTGQTGQIGQKGIYQTDGTYAEQSDNLIDAKTFNAALKNALDSEFVCADRPDAYAPGTTNCWLWEIHNYENLDRNLFNENWFLNVDGWAVSDNVYTGLPAKMFAQYGISTPGFPVTFKENTIYTIKYTVSQGAGVSGSRFRIYYTDGSYTDGYSPTNGVGGTYTITTTAGKNVSKLTFAYTQGDNNISFSNVQLEEGSVATSYQPYGNVYIPQNQQ